MSNEQKLPYDVARCSGVRVAALCNQCLRKTAPGRPDGPQVYISPQVFDVEIGIEQGRNHISARKLLEYLHDATHPCVKFDVSDFYERVDQKYVNSYPDFKYLHTEHGSYLECPPTIMTLDEYFADALVA